MTSGDVAVRRYDGKKLRLAWLDSLRGAALAGMVVYHVAWDLHAYGLMATDPSVASGWLAFGRFIAGLFLTLSGFGLALAQRQGATAFTATKRLLRIAVAAALVSVATWIAVPAAPVWFGILHCIVVTNVIALMLWRLPILLLLAAAVAACLAPFLCGDVLSPSWAWTGLSEAEPHTLDFRPVLPWLAVVLAGLVIGRTRLATLEPGGNLKRFRALASAGRHSLLIYLLHQPLILGALMLAYGPIPDPQSHAALLREPAQAAAFLRQCRQTCEAGGGDGAFCTSTCHCVLTATLDRTSPATTTEAALKRCAPSTRPNSP